MRPKRRPALIYQPGNQRSRLGKFIQTGRSDQYWFENWAPVYTLLIYIE